MIALQALQYEIQVLLAHAADQKVSGFRIVPEVQRWIRFSNPMQGIGDFFLFSLSVYRKGRYNK